MGGLYDFTFAINFIGLILTLWLGIYLASHSTRYGMAWLTALTLWSLGGLFVNMLLALDPPNPPAWPAWLRALFFFWPDCAVSGQASCWLEGWLFMPALALWQHVTTLMLPGRLTVWRWGRILAGYAGIVCAIVVQSIHPILYTTPGDDPLYINSLKAGPLYPFFTAGLAILCLSSLYNLVQAASASPAALPRKRLGILIQATLIATLIVPLSIAGTGFQARLPMVAISLAVAIPIGLFGYGVLSYSAAMEGRTLRRDFLYNLALLTIVVLVYLLAGWILIQSTQAPTSLLLLLPGMAVITHSLINPAYRFMDRLFFQANARQMRAGLRHLLHLAGEGKAFEDSLAEALRGLCTSVNASYGLILVFEDQSVRQAAACRFSASLAGLRQDDLVSDDVESLEPGRLAPPLQDAVLLVPLYADDSQVGALLLGSPANGEQYPPKEVEDLLELSDQIADVVYINQLKARTIRQMVEQAEAQRHPAGSSPAQVALDVVETALRNLHDYTYLADTPLANLQLVRARLGKSEATHLERGKAVHEVLLVALEKLCPPPPARRDLTGAARHDPPRREWHAYLILHGAYQEETPNRDIMARLYISEGTFNRTRRAAIRTVARALGEMEAAARAGG